MTTHHEPFTSPRSLPADLAMGLWLLVSVYAADAWIELRRWRLVRMP